MNEPWHYTSILDAADHWQALIAGLLGFVAAVAAVVFTLRIERRKVQRDLDALKKSLAVELRQQVAHALRAGVALRNLAQSNPPITARMVQSLGTVPTPTIYPAVADKIGLLGQDAMDVVIVYSGIEVGRNGAAALIGSRDPDNITPSTIEATGVAFLTACAYAQSVLLKFRTGVPAHDQKDAQLIRSIQEATLPLMTRQTT